MPSGGAAVERRTLAAPTKGATPAVSKWFEQYQMATGRSGFHCEVRASFACAFRSWRRRSRVPLKRIAADLGLSVSTVNAWELGQRFPTGYNFELLVAYTGLPPCRLLCVMVEECDSPNHCLLAKRKVSRRPV